MIVLKMQTFLNAFLQIVVLLAITTVVDGFFGAIEDGIKCSAVAANGGNCMTGDMGSGAQHSVCSMAIVALCFAFLMASVAA